MSQAIQEGWTKGQLKIKALLLIHEKEGRAVVVEDGFIIDQETGDILHEPDGFYPEQEQPQEEFRIDNEDALQWALQKLSDMDARKLALLAQKDKALEYFNQAIRSLDQRRKWFLWRPKVWGSNFFSQMTRLARTLRGSKKSYKNACGTVSFRSSKARPKIDYTDLTREGIDQFLGAEIVAKAVEIKRELKVSMIPREKITLILQAKPGELPTGITITPDQETETLDSGLRLGSKRVSDEKRQVDSRGLANLEVSFQEPGAIMTGTLSGSFDESGEVTQKPMDQIKPPEPQDHIIHTVLGPAKLHMGNLIWINTPTDGDIVQKGGDHEIKT